ncbi:hypothetical protein LTR84_002091 [Exophiala bonariae]|uniref:Uncharacterized protein n=1 Tax=Exophiala bonariae TaxID=1690606 RepID=A0AAV9NEA3_9EURO|nr:hypothetical protein LTR84_002091 [Exophiala bonariae]
MDLLADSIARPVSAIPALDPSPPSDSTTEAGCGEKLVHAMHTLTIEKPCPVCEAEREARLASFQARMRDDMGQRMSTRLTSMNNGAGWRGRQFRATSTSSPRPIINFKAGDFSSASSEACEDEDLPSASLGSRRPSATNSVRTDVSIAGSTAVSVQDAFGSFMRGVKGSWNVPDGRSLFSPSLSSTGRQSTLASPVSPRSRTPVAGALGAAHSSVQSVDAKNPLPDMSSGGRAMLSFGGLAD